MPVKKVKDIMSRDIVFVSSNADIKEIIRTMIEKNIHSVVVREGLYFKGFVTDDDVFDALRTLILDGFLPKRTADSLISSPTIKIDQENTVEEAILTMARNNVKYLLVEKEGNVVGLVSVTDLLKMYIEE
ncbi:MAG: cyclic nucleotide-binding/CBS domain-containing protein [Candidatus Hydrothermarchaeota archaeon]